jgi:hypothetical protein
MSLPNPEADMFKAPVGSPTEEKRHSDTNLTQSSAETPPPTILSRKSQLYFRLFAFVIIELGFIILGAVCLAKPIPLNIKADVNDAQIKGGFTVVFVVWQSAAILMGAYMAADAFSREWSVQLNHLAPSGDGTEKVVPEMIDRVSTMTSGYLDRALHLWRGKPSGQFKVAFLASLSFLVLSSLGPGAINASITLIDVPTTIQIGRLMSHPLDSDTQEVFTAQSRADLILRLEKIEHSPFGLKLPPNMLAPVPKVDLTTFNGTIEYDSDVIEFHHDCHWEAPQYFNVSGSIVVASAGQQWAGATVGAGQINVGSSIGPLSLQTFPIMEKVGKSAFIFSGGNSSVLDRRSNPPVPYAVDLTSLPTTLTAQGAGLDEASNSLYAPLSSILICDPRPQITGGRISVASDGTLTVLSSGKAVFGNIPLSAANLIFTNAFGTALVQVETLTTANVVNNLASAMFMANSSGVDWNHAQGVRPLDLPSINQNMDIYMLSGAKAYIDGYTKNGSSSVVEFDLDTVSALGHEEKNRVDDCEATVYRDYRLCRDSRLPAVFSLQIAIEGEEVSVRFEPCVRSIERGRWKESGVVE